MCIMYIQWILFMCGIIRLLFLILMFVFSFLPVLYSFVPSFPFPFFYFYHFIVGCIPFFNICVRKVDPVWNINLAAKVILAQTLDYVCMRVYKLLDVYKMMTYYARAFISFVTLTHLIKYWLVSCVSVCVRVSVCGWLYSVSFFRLCHTLILNQI